MKNLKIKFTTAFISLVACSLFSQSKFVSQLGVSLPVGDFGSDNVN